MIPRSDRLAISAIFLVFFFPFPHAGSPPPDTRKRPPERKEAVSPPKGRRILGARERPLDPEGTEQRARPLGKEAFRSPYARWPRAFPQGRDFFPIGVWLQNPSRAEAYKAIGINVYVGLWKGPTREQLEALRKAGMIVVCAQNEVGLEEGEGVVAAWMQKDEPDNAQRKPGGGYGPPIPPAEIQRRYREFLRKDPDRPVFLNLGQGVANDQWRGRGVRTGQIEDYPEYVRGADILSFDIYPVTSPQSHIRGRLEYVAKGVERLVRWSREASRGSRPKIVWNVLESSRIRSKTRPTPAQVRTEAWMALIHGSRGLIWFSHEWVPSFREDALLRDPEMREAISRINHRILRLAPVLNSEDRPDLVSVRSSSRKVPIATMVKEALESIWIFAVSMAPAPAEAKFRVKGMPARAEARVLDEDRRIPVSYGTFKDRFDGYAVHLYRLPKQGLQRKGR